MRTVVWVGDPADYTREQHDLASAVFSAALAEVGYTVNPVWGGDRYWTTKGEYPPEPACSNARRLALDAAGIPWKWVDQ